MRQTAIGIAVATVVFYLWGFAYWGASSIPYQTWLHAPDDKAAGAALLEHFPESGVYYVPGNDYSAEERSALFEQGPTGWVILDRDGRPAFDSNIMLGGFLLNGIVVVVFAILLRLTFASAPTYAERFRLVAIAGAAGVLLINFGDIVWWAIPSGWILAQAFYNFVGVLIVGAILAYFVRPESS